ncbi:MerR family transcriptional regulator [Methylosinus sp. Sm6]|uniref:MerR family transcriptional regulator n=1 Tax=Methylosinus sp. Sm6 TaxID=2866948 RepID=UPI001C98EBBF|nr:MerR family transcriptional regulator [Methylosinus sp. Sm6]MBY6240635.1 MerR family transcriptional regulator [Methylosinus sp. Sm6]
MGRGRFVPFGRGERSEAVTTGKDEGAFRTIGEVAESLDLPAHVLRFWETRFSEIEPVKRNGGRRYYRPRDVELVAAIRHLLYGRGYTIKGVQRLLREQGVRAVIENVRSGALEPRAGDLRGEEAEPSLFSRAELAEPPAPERQAGAALVAVSPREPATLTLPALRLSEAPAGGLGPRETQRLREALEDISECRRMLLLTVR